VQDQLKYIGATEPQINFSLIQNRLKYMWTWHAIYPHSTLYPEITSNYPRL